MTRAATQTLAGLMRYVRPHKRVLAHSFSLSLLSTLLGMAQPLFAKFLIDRVMLARQAELLMPVLGVLVLVLLAGFAVRAVNSWIYTRYAADVLFRMRGDLFDHLQRVPLSFYSRNKIGDIYSRLGSDMAQIQALVTETLPGLLFNLLTVAATAAVLVWLNPRMALLSLCSLPPTILMVRRIKPRLVTLGRAVAESNADISHFLFEALSGTSVIRAFGAETLESRKLSQKQTGLLALLMQSQLLRQFAGCVPLVFTLMNMAVLYGYGGRLVIDGGLSLGALVAFAFYQGRVFGPIQALMDGYLALQSARVAIERVDQIRQVSAETGPEANDDGGVVLEPAGIRGTIAFEGVSFAYEKDAPVLRNLSFTLPAGQVTAIVGPNGAGKSTICHLITGLLKPDSGCITLDGIDLAAINRACLRKRIALLSQDSFLFHTTIRENLCFGRPEATDSQIAAAAAAAGVHDFIQGLSAGYDTVIGDRGVRLSGGQKQLIGIARALLMDPAILILDEPTAFLDPDHEQHMKHLFDTLMRGRTIVLVSHRPATIRKAESIVALDAAGLVYSGPRSDFSQGRGARPHLPGRERVVPAGEV